MRLCRFAEEDDALPVGNSRLADSEDERVARGQLLFANVGQGAGALMYIYEHYSGDRTQLLLAKYTGSSSLFRGLVAGRRHSMPGVDYRAMRDKPGQNVRVPLLCSRAGRWACASDGGY